MVDQMNLICRDAWRECCPSRGATSSSYSIATVSLALTSVAAIAGEPMAPARKRQVMKMAFFIKFSFGYGRSKILFKRHIREKCYGQKKPPLIRPGNTVPYSACRASPVSLWNTRNPSIFAAIIKLTVRSCPQKLP